MNSQKIKTRCLSFILAAFLSIIGSALPDVAAAACQDNFSDSVTFGLQSRDRLLSDFQNGMPETLPGAQPFNVKTASATIMAQEQESCDETSSPRERQRCRMSQGRDSR